MKTIQELYNEIMESQELKAQFIEAAKAGKQEEFLKAHGCEATLEEVQAFLEAKQNEDAPLSFNELENAAGGCNDNTAKETALSVCTLGVGCAGLIIKSTADGDVYRFMRSNVPNKETGGRICTQFDIK